MISAKAISALDSLGVLASGKWVSLTIGHGGQLELYTSSGHVCNTNNSKKELELNFGPSKFLKLGIELAEIIDAAIDKRVLKFMKVSISADVIW